MARKPKKSAKPASVEDAMSGIYREGIEHMAEAKVNLIEAFGDMSAQMAKFFAQRIEEDVKVQHDLLHCKTLQDVQHIQLQFFEKAFKQYQENSAKMMDIGTHALGTK